MKIGKDAFLRFRNVHGEVIVCVHFEGREENILQAGFAFCNPLDFNHRRENRVLAGHGIASKRARQAPIVAGSSLILLPDTTKDMEGRKLFGVIREQVIDILRRKSANLFDFQYGGKRPGEFEKWIVPFCKELIQCTK